MNDETTLPEGPGTGAVELGQETGELAPVVAGPARVMLRDEVGAGEVSRAAEREREEAYDAVHHWWRPVPGQQEWERYELFPYSEGRERLFTRLCAANVPLDGAVKNPHAREAEAVVLLYLCSHEPEQWRGLRGDTARWLEVIEKWGEQHVPRKWGIDAVLLALKIHNEADKMQVEPVKADHRGPVGN